MNREDVSPVVMPLYDRHICLQHSLAMLGKWKIPIKLYFFQDGLPNNASCSQADRHSRVKSVASQLCRDLGIPFEYSSRDRHLGLRNNVFTSVSQLFEIFQHVFCVEDDVCVSPAFPNYCVQHLTQQRSLIVNANRFSTRSPQEVVGLNGAIIDNQLSSWYSNIFRSWGWFCTRSVWEGFNPFTRLDMSDYITKRLSHLPAQYLKLMAGYAKACNAGLNDSWAFPFQFFLWSKGQKILSPCFNMSTHIGVNGSHFSNSNISISKNLHYHYQPVYDGQLSAEMLDIGSTDVANYREIDEIRFIFGAAESSFNKFKSVYLREMRNSSMIFFPFVNVH